MCLFELIYDKGNLESYSYEQFIAEEPKRKNPDIGPKETGKSSNAKVKPGYSFKD